MRIKGDGYKIHGSTKPGIARSIEIACKRLSWKALKVIEKALDDETVEMKVRLDAAKEVFNRGWGRPKVAMEATINLGGGEALLNAIQDARTRASIDRNLPIVTQEELEKEIKQTIN